MGCIMNSVFELDAAESENLIKTAIRQKIPAILSYMSRNKWHVAKVFITERSGDRLRVECLHTESRHQPINIQEGQPVGLSFKYSYGKFIFDTAVISLQPSHDPRTGGTIIVEYPAHIEVVQRRSYFRVSVPKSLKVNVVFWHRSCRQSDQDVSHTYYQGQLMDISAGGAMMAMPLDTSENENQAEESKPAFRKGQFIGLRFTPLPYETPLVFNAQIRNILPTADNAALCLGLQIVGLEASAEGKETLVRIAEVVDKYYQMNQAGQADEMSQPTELHAEATVD